MIDFLSELAALTLGGSAAVIVLALTARLSRVRYAARWRCCLWLLLCIRLAIPVSMQLPEQVEMQSPICPTRSLQDRHQSGSRGMGIG